MESFILIGLGLGLASLAGVRAFLPLLILGAAGGVLGLFVFPDPLSPLGTPAVLWILLGLSVAEGALDKVSSTVRILNVVQTPVRAAAGAVLVSALVGIEALLAVAGGAVVAGLISTLKYVLRPPLGVVASGVSARFLSAVEDAVAAVGGAVAVFAPLLPLILPVFLLYLYYRIRRRRKKKYQGLRILSD